MFSLAYNLPKMTSNSWKFRRKKYVQTKWIFWPSKSSWTNKCVDRNAVDILTREITYKKYVVARWFFNHKNYIEKSMWKKRGFFKHRNYIEKNTWKQRGFFDHQNYFEKSTWKRHGFFNQQNYIAKVHENDVEIRRNLVFEWSSRNIHIESKSIRRGLPVG